ncbi:MAG: ABC transporter ATP-binding protein, partial [Solirubrobacteraceae bacterium]
GRWSGPDALVHAVREVTLEVGAGEILALVGESGAGKSTLGRMIMGLERPDSGEVRFEGIDLGSLRERKLRRVRRRMHLMLQDPYESLHPGMRVERAVAEPLAIMGVDRQLRAQRVADALEAVGLKPAEKFTGRFPHELSGGQRQRVAIARALAGRPRIVVADEPTSMVDASLRAEILDLITGLRDEVDMTFVIITHDLTAAHYVADRILVMQAGQIVEAGPAERVVAAPEHEYTRLLLGASGGVVQRDRGT